MKHITINEGNIEIQFNCLSKLFKKLPNLSDVLKVKIMLS